MEKINFIIKEKHSLVIFEMIGNKLTTFPTQIILEFPKLKILKLDNN